MNNAFFLVFNDDYEDYAKVCITSIKINFPNHPTILCVYDGENERIFEYLGRQQNLKLVEFDFSLLEIEKYNLGVKTHQYIYYRYLLWTDYFDEYDNILHLDVDTIVLKPLDDLFNSKDIFFCTNDFTPNGFTIFPKDSFGDEILHSMLKEDKFAFLAENATMMNAGVFLIPKKYRNKSEFEKLKYLTTRYSSYLMFGDQSAISLWCHIRGIEFSINLIYNFQACFFDSQDVIKINGYEDIIDNIHIYHLTWWKYDTKNYINFRKRAELFQSMEQKAIKYLKNA